MSDDSESTTGETSGGEWIIVKSRKSRNRDHTHNTTTDNNTPFKPRVYVKRKYWEGFDERGKQRWFIELSNGNIVSDKNTNEFGYWDRSFFRE